MVPVYALGRDDMGRPLLVMKRIEGISWEEKLARYQGNRGADAYLREHLGIPEEQIVVCGMAVGYRDPEAPENVWRTERAAVEEFTAWHGFGETESR